MKKVFQMEELDCAHCAARMEEAIAALDGVNKASVNFLTQKLTLDVEEGRLDEVLAKAQECVSKIDRHCRILA